AANPQEQIYIFDRATGATSVRIAGLPSVVTRLAFWQDGRFLAATFFGGLRVYARDRQWAEIARDDTVDADSYGAAFSPDGRLATTAAVGHADTTTVLILDARSLAT